MGGLTAAVTRAHVHVVRDALLPSNDVLSIRHASYHGR